MKRFAYSALAATLIGAAALMPAAASAGETEDVTTIHAIWDTYAAARVAGDAETWLALWDTESLKMSPGRPAEDHATMAARVRERFAPGERESMTIAPHETVVTGDWAYSRGTFTVTVLRDGQEVGFEGKFMTILKRQSDGSWRIYRDFANRNE